MEVGLTEKCIRKALSREMLLFVVMVYSSIYICQDGTRSMGAFYCM